MIRFIVALLLALPLFVSAQTPESDARSKIQVMRGVPVTKFPNYSISDAFKAVTDLSVKRVPYLTVQGLRSGMADTAQVVQILRSGTAFTYKYDASSIESDDSATVIRSGSRRYKLVVDKYTPQVFSAAGDGAVDDTEAIKKLIKYCAKNRNVVTIPKGTYKITSPIVIDSTIIKNQNGLTIRGEGSYRDVQFVYSGTGYCLNVIGAGSEGGSPITRFTIENIFINGNNNTTSDGGFNFKRVYIAKVTNCGSVSWAKSGAHAMSIRNAFNFQVDGGNYSNGFPDASGGSVVVVGSELPEAWNTSNIQFLNTAIQRGAGYGLQVLHEDNIFDNLYVENVTFGGNRGGSFYCHNPNVNNITLQNNHFESAGKNGTSTPDDAYHVDIDQSSSVIIGNNEFKDGKIHIKLHRVGAFLITPQKIYESGSYTINGSLGVSITGDASTYSRGSIFHLNIYSNQIDTPFARDLYSRIDWPFDQVTEAQWAATYANNPGLYEGAIIRRREIRAGTVDASFQQLWTSDGTSWYRIAVTERGMGWAASMPTSGSYTQGDLVFNRNPTIVGTTGLRYSVLGWRRITTGSGHSIGTDWVEMRQYFELDLSGFATTTALTTGLSGKENSITAGTTSQYWRGDKTWQNLDASAVGLGNVNNTSDANKPVSTAIQSALDLKSNDNAVVHLAGSENITAAKTFTVSPILSDAWANYQAAFGATNQAGRISFRKGTDGTHGTAIGFTAANSATDFNINNSAASGTVSISTTQGRTFQIYNDGNVALQTGGTFSNNGSKLQVTGKGTFSSDIEFTTNSTGVILRSPNGTKYRLTVNDAGTSVVLTLVP